MSECATYNCRRSKLFLGQVDHHRRLFTFCKGRNKPSIKLYSSEVVLVSVVVLSGLLLKLVCLCSVLLVIFLVKPRLLCHRTSLCSQFCLFGVPTPCFNSLEIQFPIQSDLGMMCSLHLRCHILWDLTAPFSIWRSSCLFITLGDLTLF